MMRLAFITLFLFSSAVRLFGDEWADYFGLMYKYSAAQSASGSIATSYFYSNSPKAFKTETGSFVIEGTKKFLKYDDCIMINNDQYNVTLDKKNKVLMVSNSMTQEGLREFIKGLNGSVNDTVHLRQEAILKNTENSEVRKVYELTYKNKGHQFDKLVYEFSAKTGVIKRVTYYLAAISGYKENPTKIQIEYQDLSFDKSINKASFNEKSVATISNSSITPAADYKSFRIVDYRKLQNHGK